MDLASDTELPPESWATAQGAGPLGFTGTARVDAKARGFTHGAADASSVRSVPMLPATWGVDDT
jgi:hypothetical protein